ncbi:Iron chelate uptake ABC transporter, FeCT family, permease protein [uncultured Eubacteriales bacterium]|uniref:Iron chelate uptake ABC transporter, FeCT family, permease protein n=1 Tax=uncultured Eubacteriales bacterium TaxID=172733 RepID=A0A212KEY6_9FIRM|nr:Iron chelate uptake ABC transporter, FeCT family, permease protein [uncultured Eubacteriales bacterium]
MEVVARSNRKKRLIILALCLLLLAVCALSVTVGRYPVPLRELGGMLLSKFVSIEPFWTSTMEKVLFNVRLPRLAMACLVGCALSTAGCAYQGVFQNPMASPDILGASKGAAFGAALAILLGAGGAIVMGAAFLSGLLSLALVLLASARAKGKRVVNLILAGIIVSSLFEAGTSYIKLVADPSDTLPSITYWLMGSIAGATGRELTFVFWPVLAGSVVLFLLRWQLGILTLGEDEARAMGVNAPAVRMAVLLCATLLTAVSVSTAGVISWVGLVVPHLARRLVGSNYRYLMPASMVLGSLFLLVVDGISRNLLLTEIPLGILTAVVGAPFFLYLMTRGGGEV